MKSNDESTKEFRVLTEEEKQEYLIENRELSFEQFKDLSDEEQSKYLKANGIEDGSFEEFLESFKKDIEAFKETNDKMKKNRNRK
jgi:chloramphenicol O-acetyltransferase